MIIRQLELLIESVDVNLENLETETKFLKDLKVLGRL